MSHLVASNEYNCAAMNNCHLLIIGAVWPEPNSTAAGSRMMQLIALFQQQGWRVTFATPAVPSPHALDLTAHHLQTATIELNNPSFDHFVSAQQPDIVLFDRFMIEEQFGWRVAEQCPDALRILNTEDLHFLRKARHSAVKSGQPSPDLLTDLAKREIAAILRSDLSIIISEVEVDLLVNQFQIAPALLHYTPFMLPPVDDTNWLDFGSRQHFVTIGNFRHAPNWDAVLQLKQKIWPLLKGRVQEAELHIYGAYPPPKATALHNPRERFFVRGWAADAMAVMQNARICLAPLRFGAGLKGKLITAMQAGTPSVTTPIGAEGMHGQCEWGGVVSADPIQFADAAAQLYRDPKAWQTAQTNGLTILNTRFNATQHGTHLIERITKLRANLEQGRRANFTGAMLRHHTMQSTRYMARWIEAKNRL